MSYKTSKKESEFYFLQILARLILHFLPHPSVKKQRSFLLYINMSDMCYKKVFGRWQYQFKIPCITYYRKQKIDKKYRNVSYMVSNKFPISLWRFCFIMHIAAYIIWKSWAFFYITPNFDYRVFIWFRIHWS